MLFLSSFRNELTDEEHVCAKRYRNEAGFVPKFVIKTYGVTGRRVSICQIDRPVS